MRIAHIPTTVGGNSFGLSRAERKLGNISDVIVDYPSSFSYKADYILFKKKPKSRVESYLQLIKRIIWILIINLKYEVVHFNFLSSLLDLSYKGWDLIDTGLYPFKKKFVTVNGCDVRYYRSETSGCVCERIGCSKCRDLEIIKSKQRRVEIFNKHAQKLFYVNPDLSMYLPRRAQFIPYTVASMDPISWREKEIHSPVRIVHAPSNRNVKGTDYILKAVESLKNKGYVFDFKLIENCPHDQAVMLFKQCDLAIDQLKIGWYGGFAVEAMRYGLPVICYINTDDLNIIPSRMAKECLEAVVNSDCHNIEGVLENLICTPNLIKHFSLKAREYVFHWHNSVSIARYILGETTSFFNNDPRPYDAAR